jgi:hypothetical protein
VVLEVEGRMELLEVFKNKLKDLPKEKILMLKICQAQLGIATHL